MNDVAGPPILQLLQRSSVVRQDLRVDEFELTAGVEDGNEARNAVTDELGQNGSRRLSAGPSSGSECATQGVEQRALAERLEQAFHRSLFEEARPDGVVRMSRDEDHRHLHTRPY